MQSVIDIIKTMPRSEKIGGALFIFGFPILFTAIWVVTPS
jgi:hypothetical protein